MTTTNRVAEIGALVGEPARAAMLAALTDGRALTASELSYAARITPQTASSHLARLVGAGLLAVEKQGRHRYHRLASAAVAHMLEGIMQIASEGEGLRRPRTGPRDEAMRLARSCYDHLAGRLAVAIAEAMVERHVIEFEDDGGLVTESGQRFLDGIGIALPAPAAGGRRSARPLCRPCLDWSERRAHVAGQLGAALCRHSLDQAWFRRLPETRALAVTPKGRLALHKHFGIALDS
jgi:DNA-binding transcriptional ArsR family regulator